MHGADWNAVYKKYSPLLPSSGIGPTSDTSSRSRAASWSSATRISAAPATNPPTRRCRSACSARTTSSRTDTIAFSTFYSGENWNPELRAPLSDARRPGVRGRLSPRGERPAARAAHERLQRVRGHGRIIRRRIRVNKTPTLEGSRSSRSFRSPAKTACARAPGSSTTGASSTRCRTDRLAYVWLPNTGGGGYTYFTRYYYAQQEKEGAVIDERYNQGGQVADYIVNELDRKPMGYFAQRDGKIVDVAGRGHLRPEGHDHQRVGRLRRRCAAVLLQAAQDRPAGRHAHVGRARRHARRSGDDRRRRHHGAESRVL